MQCCGLLVYHWRLMSITEWVKSNANRRQWLVSSQSRRCVPLCFISGGHCSVLLVLVVPAPGIKRRDRITRTWYVTSLAVVVFGMSAEIGASLMDRTRFRQEYACGRCIASDFWHNCLWVEDEKLDIRHGNASPHTGLAVTETDIAWQLVKPLWAIFKIRFVYFLAMCTPNKMN